MAKTVRIEIPISTIDNTEPNVTRASNNLKKLARSANEATKSTDNLKRHTSSFLKNSERMGKQLSSWTKEKYRVLLEAKDRISPILHTIGPKLKGFANKTYTVSMKVLDKVTSPVRSIFRLLKNPLLQAGAVLGIGLTASDTINTYANFEDKMQEAGVISGATNLEMKKLTETAEKMGKTTKFTASESADALKYMGMAGWKAQEMIDGLPGILNLAAASGTDLGTTSDIVTDALTAFKLTAKDAGHFSDVLAATSTSANTNVAMMGETFKYAGAMAGTLGYSIEDVALMTGLMANSGIKATMAGTSLNNIFTRLSTNQGHALDTLKGLGIEFFDSTGKARKLGDVMGELREKTKNMNDEQKTNIANTIAGTQAQKGLLAILNATDADYNKLQNSINNSNGAASKMSKAMLKTLKGNLITLQSAVDGVKLALGKRLAPYIGEFVNYLKRIMPSIEQGIQDFMDKFDVGIERFKAKFKEVTGSLDFKNADFFGKAGILWDEMIVKPFSKWWQSTGHKFFMNASKGFGETLGSGIKHSIMFLLGLDVPTTINEGATIGSSFASGFVKGLDFGNLSGKITNSIGKIFKNLGKFTPGGSGPDLSSFFTAFLTYKLGKGLFKAGGIGKSILGKGSPLRGLIGGVDTMDFERQGTGLLGFGARLGTKLSGGMLTGVGASALGLGTVAGGVIGGVALGKGAIDTYTSLTSKDKRKKNAYRNAATSEFIGVGGGAAAGALIGSVVPVVGTAAGAIIGAGLGGVAGMINGNREKKKYEKQIEQENIDKFNNNKVFEAIGRDIKHCNFETKALNKAVKDTNVSAADFRDLFNDAVNKKTIGAFGKLKLSLQEIKEASESIVVGQNKGLFDSFNEAIDNASNSYETIKSIFSNTDKLNWKLSLNGKVDEGLKDEIINNADEMIKGAKKFLEDKHYEARVSLDLLFGPQGDNSLTLSIDGVYGKLQEQLNGLDGELHAKIKVALEDGVITLDEQKEIANIQEKIRDIVNKVNESKMEAKFSALQIKFSGSQLDADSFAQLQEQLTITVQEQTANYDKGLEISLSSVNLALKEGAISPEACQEMTEKIKAEYEKNINNLQLKVQSFQLQSIADAYSSDLDGILPQVQGTTADKLGTAMSQALAVNPNPKTWTQEEISSWFGLENLSTEAQTAIGDKLKATAETLPQKLTESLTGAMANIDLTQSMNDFGNKTKEAMVGALKIALPTVDALTSSGFVGPFTNAGTQYGTSMTNAMTSALSNSTSQLQTAANSAVNSAFSSPFNVTATVNVTPHYNILGGNVGSLLARTVPNGYAVGRHASGGFVNGKQLSWVGEEGAEAIIPLVPGRRSRALQLFEQTGKMLGLGQYADGGIVKAGTVPTYKANSEAVVESKNINVSVTVNPQFNIDGKGQDEENVLAVIKKHMKQLADDLGGEIAYKLDDVLSNMPTQGA